VTDEGEECDDGEPTSVCLDPSDPSCNDWCTSDCTIAECGDGIVCSDPGTCTTGPWDDDISAYGAEECDDGNQVPGDGCDTACGLEACGDGVTQDNEQCDGGDATAYTVAECSNVEDDLLGCCYDGEVDRSPIDGPDAGEITVDEAFDALLLCRIPRLEGLVECYTKRSGRQPLVRLVNRIEGLISQALAMSQTGDERRAVRKMYRAERKLARLAIKVGKRRIAEACDAERISIILNTENAAKLANGIENTLEM
jgi:cysteine-rich repeat protein